MTFIFTCSDCLQVDVTLGTHCNFALLWCELALYFQCFWVSVANKSKGNNNKIVSKKCNKVVSKKCNKVVSKKCNKVVYKKCNKVVSKKCNKVVCAIVHKFANIKTIECNNIVSSSIGFACSSWNSVKRYDLVALSKINVCNKVVKFYDTTLLHWCDEIVIHPKGRVPLAWLNCITGFQRLWTIHLSYHLLISCGHWKEMSLRVGAIRKKENILMRPWFFAH